MFAVIFLPDFELQAVLRCAPELRPCAVALIDGAPENAAKAVVLSCTGQAKDAGVCAGLTMPQAQARCRELLLKPRSFSAEQRATEILLQTAGAFSPNIENTAPGVCTIDLRGLNFSGSQNGISHSPIPNTHEEQNFFNATAANNHTAQQSFEFFENAATPSHLVEERGKPEIALLEAWATAIITSLSRVGLGARVGIASTPNIALLAARAAAPLLVIEHCDSFFNSLPAAALEPAPHVLHILKRWGIHTAGAFLALGKNAIAERLGAEALELFERASTRTIRPLTIVLPPETFEEQMDFEAHIETIEPLLFVLRRFVEQLATRITLTYRVVAELQLTLALESGVFCERTFKIPAPTANVETLFRMLHTHLENLRTDAPIQSLWLAAAPVRAEGQQFGLFESALRDPNHFHETLARLTALLGADRVGTPMAEPTHRPDTFRMDTPDFGQGASPKAIARNSKLEIRNSQGVCLRRFRPAILADVELKDGLPSFIGSLSINGRIVKRPRGPWSTSGTWWDQRRWLRQEWDVETSDGAVYRLFQADGNWMVEGIYD